MSELDAVQLDAPCNIVILAAGKGTRMQSQRPKVLHTLAGKPLLQHVVDVAKSLQPHKIIVVYGYGGEAVPQAMAHEALIWVEQTEQLGTGHAVQQALPHLDAGARVLVLLGDVPLLSAAHCLPLLQAQGLALLSVVKQTPAGYGRIVRNASGQVEAIVEHKDATAEQRLISEVNTGIMAMPAPDLQRWLGQLTSSNAQGEYYLTDIVGMAAQEGSPVSAQICQDEWAVTGVNNKLELATLERVFQRRQAERLLLAGVSLADAARLDVRGDLQCGQEVQIDIGCIFEGKVVLGDGVRIGAYCVIRDAEIAAGTQIAPYSHIDQVTIGAHARIGPFARLRPGTTLAEDTHIGNFVELKNAQVDSGSKINHLSYVGDATVGKQVNIGAGTITCNYDGANKFRTVIEDEAFIGSDSQLVAPVTVGRGATIGAGSTITRNAPPGELTLGRSRQTTVSGWKRPQKLKK